MGKTIARLNNVTFGYPGGVPVFENFSWQMEEGESWAVIGPSGCGKSTLLHLLAGLRLPSSGTVEVEGSLVRGPRHETGLVLQDYGLLPWGTARQNVELGLRIRGRERSESAQITQMWLERLGLSELHHRYPNQLSGGQRQRVAIARTLALDPEMLLMDEPFSSLDAMTRESLEGLALELGVARGLSTVLVTHDIQEAVFLGRHILLLTGAHPNQRLVIDNPGAGDPAYRGKPAFQRRAEEVRERFREYGTIVPV